MRSRRSQHKVKITIEFDLFEQLTRTAWRRALLLIAKEECEMCGASDNLHCHHIDENRENNCLANGMVLCAPCHMKIHKGHEQ